jgi:pyruvate dehydrogenase E1 component
LGDAAAVPYVQALLAGEEGVFVAASDYVKALPLAIARWVPGPYTVLGTDGYGLSESREDLRAHFEVSAAHIACAALSALAAKRAVANKDLKAFARRHGIDPAKPDASLGGPPAYRAD